MLKTVTYESGQRYFKRLVLAEILPEILADNHWLNESRLNMLWDDFADYFTHI